jgi:hypothetical protein
MKRTVLQRWYACGFCLFCSLPNGAVAADYLSMDLEQLLQVRVTGSTLRDESLNIVPAQVTVFTRDQLDSLGLDYRLGSGRTTDDPLDDLGADSTRPHDLG